MADGPGSVPLVRVLLPLSLSGLLCSCATLQPTPELRPVAIGDGKGSARTTVDPGLPPQVELHWDGRGPLMVRPLINEADVGLFVLDTGASGMLISGKAADEAGLLAIGTTRLQDGSDTTVFLGLASALFQGTHKDYFVTNFLHRNIKIFHSWQIISKLVQFVVMGGK